MIYFYLCVLTVSLVEAVYLEYARLLANLGLRAPAEFYCQKAGDKGRQFKEEVRILFTWNVYFLCEQLERQWSVWVVNEGEQNEMSTVHVLTDRDGENIL